MSNPTLIKLIGYLKSIFLWGKISRKREKEGTYDRNSFNEFEFPKNIQFCHKDKVHIFVRGLADNKLHSAKNRNYSDIRFYKKENLKVFCAICRKRII